MFCEKCGNQLNGNEQFCGFCGEPVNQNGVGSGAGGGFGGIGANGGQEGKPSDPLVVKRIVARVLVGAASIALGVVAILFFVQLVTNIEPLVDAFSGYDGAVAGFGTAGFVLCGLIVVMLAGIPCWILARLALFGNIENANYGLSIGLCIAELVICLATWICKLIFRSPAGSDAAAVLYQIFFLYGGTATTCLIIASCALVAILIARSLPRMSVSQY